MRTRLIGVVSTLVLGLATPALAAPTNAIEKARPIVNANVGDVPAPNEGGILNNIDEPEPRLLGVHRRAPRSIGVRSGSWARRSDLPPRTRRRRSAPD
jgi:hypothetical protein